MSAQWSDQHLDDLLGQTAGSDVLPAPSAALLEAVQTAKPAKVRQPYSRAALLLLFGGLQAVGLSIALGFRRDIELLPRAWFIAYVAAWALSFVVLAWGAQVPPRGQVMPRSGALGRLGVAFGVAFASLGIVFAEHVPGVSKMYDPTVASVIKYAPYCFTVGVSASLLPILFGGYLVRGAAPRGARWLGAGVGAGSGSLGGLLLHLHCPIAEGFHLGLVHGGVVLIAAALGALLLPLVAQRR